MMCLRLLEVRGSRGWMINILQMDHLERDQLLGMRHVFSRSAGDVQVNEILTVWQEAFQGV